MEWSTNNVAAAQAIRKYFPRPHFVSTQAEVALVKKIFVDGPIAGGHQIVSSTSSYLPTVEYVTTPNICVLVTCYSVVLYCQQHPN